MKRVPLRRARIRKGWSLEALSAYEIMEALWPGDTHIMGLRDLTRHW